MSEPDRCERKNKSSGEPCAFAYGHNGRCSFEPRKEEAPQRTSEENKGVTDR
jgi:hypothetical protein